MIQLFIFKSTVKILRQKKKLKEKMCWHSAKKNQKSSEIAVTTHCSCKENKIHIERLIVQLQFHEEFQIKGLQLTILGHKVG